MTSKEMPIFTRTFDMLAWLLPASNHFPRAFRHSFTQRLLQAAFDLSEALQEANLRFVDDFLLFDDDKARLRLAIHPQAQLRPASKGIQYRRRFLRLLDDHAAGALPLADLTASVRGWANHARYGNTAGLRKAVLSGRTIPRAVHNPGNSAFPG